MTWFHVIDAHVHLYDQPAIERLSWARDLRASHILRQPYTINAYEAAIAQAIAAPNEVSSVNETPSPRVLGIVFIEADRISGLDKAQWIDALNEIEYTSSLAHSLQKEQLTRKDVPQILAIIPWAPLPLGHTALEAYFSSDLLSRCVGTTTNLIKGVRYLLQDKPAGTMLTPGFIEALRWVADRGWSFDLGIDFHSVGSWQGLEALEMLRRVYDGWGTVGGNKELVVVVNHFCKPDFVTGKDYDIWKEVMSKLAGFKGVYIKMSGFFAEMEAQDEQNRMSIARMTELVKVWVKVVFEKFGPKRVMFGSDWPVCNLNGPGGKKSWAFWIELVKAVLLEMELSKEDQDWVWWRSAKEAYRIDVDVLNPE